MSYLRSAVKLVLIVLCSLWRSIRSLLSGDAEAAAEHARSLVISIHEDLLSLLVVVQRRLPWVRKSTERINRILIVKLDRIGDMVNTTPVFDALRRLYPSATLDLVGHPVALQLLEGDERIHERIPYRSCLYHKLLLLPPGPAGWWLIVKLFWRRYDLVVYLRGSVPFLPLGLVSRFAAAKFVQSEPVIERYLKAIRSVCGPVDASAPRLYLSPESIRFARELLDRTEGVEHDNAVRRKIIVHAAASSAGRMWPVERFAAFADEAQRRFNADIHFLGSRADRPVLEKIERSSKQCHSYHWSLSLPQTSALIALGDVFVGNDSGLSHIAAAIGTSSVVLWGAANLSMARPTAPADKCIMLYHELACRAQCVEFRCHNAVRLDCLMRTQVRDVVDAVGRLVGSPNGTSADVAAPVDDERLMGMPFNQV